MSSELPAEVKKSDSIVYGMVALLFGVIAYLFPYILMLFGNATFSGEGTGTATPFVYYMVATILSVLGIFFASKAIKASKTNSLLGLSGLIVSITALLTYTSQMIFTNIYF